MKWSFLGGASEVTGSKHLLDVGMARILFDCGLYQGPRQLSEKLNRNLGFPAGTVDAVVVSHAHIDHCGALPLLVKEGYQGPIHCTSSTADLLPVMPPSQSMSNSFIILSPFFTGQSEPL